MAFFRSNPSIFVILFTSSTLFPFSNAAAQLQNLGVNHVGEATRRYLDEVPNKSATLILAANRTHRRDPSNGFKFYTGGWNITSEHYAYSVAFSAAPLFVVAIVWLLVFGVYMCCMCLRRCCCCCYRIDRYGYSQTAYALSLIFLVLFTIAAIAGSVYLYSGQGKFQNSTVNVLSYVLKEVDTIIQNLRDVFNYLLGAQKTGVGQTSLPPELQANIDNMQGQINSVTDHLRKVTATSSDDIRNFLDPMRITLIYVTSAMLLLSFLGFLFSILGLQCIVYFLMIIGWIAVVGTFILSGMFLFLHNAVEDTCVAMDEWLQNPTAHSALEHIIPKVDDQTAQAVLKGTKGVTFGLVNVTNMAIIYEYNADVPPDGPFYANRSGPPMPRLCNPFNLDLTDRQCLAGEVDFKNATEVWRNYICQVSKSGLCTTPGRISPSSFNELTASMNITFGLYHYSSFLVDLVDSAYLKETFSDISKNYCPSMWRSSQWMYVGFTIISASVMLSVIFWVVYARERRHRKYTKKLLAGPKGRQFNVMKAV